MQRVWILDAVRTKDGRRSFTLQGDLALLGSKLTEIGDVAMITIDPITSYMGKIDSHRTTDVRGVLEPLSAFAEQHHVAILAVSHPPKASQAKALHSVTGSLAFVAAARMVFIVVEEPETGRRLFLPAKNNLAAMPAGLAYRLEQRFVVNFILASHVVWDREPVTVNANQALAEDRAAASGDDELREAKDFLREALAAGARPAKDVEQEAKALGITERTRDAPGRRSRWTHTRTGIRGRGPGRYGRHERQRRPPKAAKPYIWPPLESPSNFRRKNAKAANHLEVVVQRRPTHHTAGLAAHGRLWAMGGVRSSRPWEPGPP